MIDAASAPWEVLAVCLILLVASAVASQRAARLPWLAGIALTVGFTLFASDGRVAYAAIGVTALLHAVTAARFTRTGAAAMVFSAALAGAAAVTIATGHTTAAFALSCLLLAVRAGVLPFHVGVTSLCERAPVVQTQQLATTLALVFVHLRFVAHQAEAVVLAQPLVRYGAAASFAAALLALVQKDLRGLYRASTSLHAGLLLAAVGAASLHNFAAALLVAVAMALALGGLGITITSLEERVGPVDFTHHGGHVHALPTLAACFGLFAAAGVGMPGTAGFVADDLLLHTLWMQSPAATVSAIVSAALLAVASLTAYSKIFLGRRTTRLLAPDLSLRERAVAVMLLAALVILGVAPGTLLHPADAFLDEPVRTHVLTADPPLSR